MCDCVCVQLRGEVTCGKVFIDSPVVHLERCVSPVPDEPYYMVLAIIDRDAALLHQNISHPNVERDSNFPSFLKDIKSDKNQRLVFYSHIQYVSNQISTWTPPLKVFANCPCVLLRGALG